MRVESSLEKVSSVYPSAISTAINPYLIRKIALKCADCGQWMSLKQGKYGLTYFCKSFPVCRGSHKASKKGKPLGFPGDKETRHWRIRAHKALESLYKGNGRVMTKTEAYGFMAYSMGLKAKQAHVSRLNLEQCKEVVDLLEF